MAGLNEEEIATLSEIAGLIIPASAAYDVPGADDPAIMAGIVAAANRDPAAIRAALEAFIAADSAEVFRSGHPAHASRLQTIVAFAYYRDRRVLASLSAEARAPFPNGYEVEQGDTAALDRVRSRGPIWRKV